MKKGMNLCLLIILLFCFFVPTLQVNAVASYEVYVEDQSGSKLVSSFATYKEAHTFALSKETESQNNNVLIYKDGKLRYATYGLVNFRTKSASKYTTSYTIDFNNKQGYTNGFYGADAAFLGTNEEGTKVKFKQAGVIGWVNYDEVSIINMNAKNYVALYTSSYIAGNLSDSKTNEFMHNIATDINSSSMTTIVLGQEIPTGVKLSTKNNRTYYLSYDGHYFYPENLEGYRAMIRDYKKGVSTNAVNANDPYYNYYQFLSHRSITNYTSDHIKQDLSIYTSKVTGEKAQAWESQLFGEETSFIQYQNEFGANAILMLGAAKNESNNGTSNIAINNNNLFGHKAYDYAPGASAAGYVSVAQSIYTHAKGYISEGYADPCDGYQANGNGASSKCHQGRYYGSYVGDKSSGMNVSYASDPYWGEKAAKNYYYFDKKYGLQDYRKYGIGVKTSTNSYPIKSNPSSSSATLYNTGNSNSYAVTILSSVTGETINGSNVWYKIQTDPTLNQTKTGILQDQGAYNFDHNVGYIHSSYLGYVKLGKSEKRRYTIKFNPNGGKFSDNITSTKSLTVEEYVIPDINPPSKDGYRFVGWNQEVVAATENITYTAQYEPIVTTYQITFDAKTGVFSDGSKTKQLEVKMGVVPNIESPTLKGYIFVGWSPKLVAASKNMTYTAEYTKETEIEWKEVGGEFYFHELTSNDTGLYMKGYSTINGIQSNVNSKVSYEIAFENIDTNKTTTFQMDRIMKLTEMPFSLGTMNGYDATYSWFQGTIPIKDLEAGNYRAYIIAKSGNVYTKKLVRNLFGKKMIGNYENSGKQIWIRNNYYLKTVPMEFFVRENIVGKKNNNPIDNMITGYSRIYFEGSQLKVRGFAHNVDGNYATSALVSRTIILENTKTYQTIQNAIPTITNGDYMISLRVPDGFDKTKAWFDGGIDISSLEKGVYVIYIANIANINDFAELNDIFNKKITSTTTLNGKKYSLKVNADARYRIELIVE